MSDATDSIAKKEPRCPITVKRELAGTIVFPINYPERGRIYKEANCDQEYIVVEQEDSQLQIIRTFVRPEDIRAVSHDVLAPDRSIDSEFLFGADLICFLDAPSIEKVSIHIDPNAQIVFHVECGVLAKDLHFSTQQRRVRSEIPCDCPKGHCSQ